MDGRFPTVKDYDLFSQMTGADYISINNQLPLWRENGWNTSAGVVVVVGVKKASEDEKYVVLLSSKGKADPKNLTRIDVGQSIAVN